jgi:hypothetical protein
MTTKTESEFYVISVLHNQQLVLDRTDVDELLIRHTSCDAY